MSKVSNKSAHVWIGECAERISHFIRTHRTNTTGSTAVRKLVTGNLGDQNRAFHFKVVLSDTGLNGWSGDMEFTNGVAQFTLHSGEHLWARYLPVGTSYTVMETEADQEGCWTITSGNESVIYGISRLEARFQNHKGDWLPEYDAGVEPNNMDENRFDNILNIKGGCVNMCKGAIGIAKDAMLKGEEKAFEEISHIMQGIRDGLSDNNIRSKYNIDIKRVQQIRAYMDR